MSVQFKELDLGWDKIHQNIKESSSKIAVVGIIGGGEELRKAVANEFGTDKIPERPFMRQTFDKVEPEIKKKKKEGLNQIIFDNASPSRVLSRIGNFYRSEIRKAIRNREFKANSEFTIRRKNRTAKKKGNPIPLIDTGKMIQSLKVEIRND
jgi:hypothetical protein